MIILLNLLKVIGIIILVLIAALLVLLLLIMFVPLRYRVTGGKNALIHADAHVTWLLHLIHVMAVYRQQTGQEGLHLKLRVLGITLYDNQKPAKEKKKAQETEKPKIPDAPAPPEPPEPVKETAVDNTPEEAKPAEPEKEKAPAEKTEKKTKEAAAPKEPGSGISEKLESLQEKLEKLRCKKEKLICLLDNPKNSAWLDKTLFRLKQLILYLLPEIRKLQLHFGFDDPSSTGMALGGLSMLYPVCEDRMTLVPEFDRKILEGEAEIGGTIRLYRFMAFAIPTFLNPRFFKIFKKVKRIVRS